MMTPTQREYSKIKNRIFRHNKKLKKAKIKYWVKPMADATSIDLIYINRYTGKAFNKITLDRGYVTINNIELILEKKH